MSYLCSETEQFPSFSFPPSLIPTNDEISHGDEMRTQPPLFK